MDRCADCGKPSIAYAGADFGFDQCNDCYEKAEVEANERDINVRAGSRSLCSGAQ